MDWFRVPKDTYPKPSSGTYYWQWKDHLSKEGKEQCVYCAININSFGGIRNFHVEHYKPKAQDKFPELEHEYSNLFFACSICNVFKGDDWNGDATVELNNNTYPDPSKTDYSSFLKSNVLHFVDSEYPCGKYVIHRLYLNRPQLVLERKKFYLLQTLKDEMKKLMDTVNKMKNQNNATLIKGFVTVAETAVLLIDEKYIRPYTDDQTKR
jgi:5-methylcytosine-specific restriction endonuclease McrA